MAQHSRADADSAVWAFMSAALQQSISPIAPPMLHDCSLECRGAPATALPATTSNTTKDMNRVLIPSLTVWKGLMPVKIRPGPRVWHDEVSTGSGSYRVGMDAVLYLVPSRRSRRNIISPQRQLWVPIIETR